MKRYYSATIKNMITIIALFLLITVFHNAYTQRTGDVECVSEGNMDWRLRRVALEQHNWKRYFLAGGNPFPGQHHVNYPTASDMNALYYDCNLENSAYDIASQCITGRPNFNYVGSNNGTYRYRAFNSDSITEIVNHWWNTALQGPHLVDLTPSQENTPMIPFLQMANGKTNRLGCALEICEDDMDVEYVLFVCTYGTEKVRLGNPIYTRGPPCGSCPNKCTFNNRLCAT